MRPSASLRALRLRFALPLGVFVGALVLAPAALAQTTGKITGRVTDAATGETLPGVNIVVEGTTVGAATDIDGEYTIIGIRPGTYTVVASYVGYATQRTENVRVSVDLTTEVDFRLGEEDIQGEEVIVQADAELVRPDLTSAEFRVTSEQIESLPVQELGDVLTAQAGVTTSGGGIHIRGGRSKEVAYFIDGVRVTDSYDGSQAVVIENDGIEELQVIAGTYNAEYGQAMSGIINVVTKDPGDTFEGSFEAFSGTYVVTGDGGADALRSANPDDYPVRNEFTYYGVDPYSYLDLDPAQYSNLQGSLSGPILGSRLGFFALGRYFRNDGWLYGARVFNPDGTRGDSALVPMNDYEKFSGQATLKFQLNRAMRLSLTGLGSYATGTNLTNYLGFRQNPEGLPTYYDRGVNVNLQFQHNLSSTAFYTANLTTFYKDFRSYAFEDPLDPRYNDFLINTPDSLEVAPGVIERIPTGTGRFLRGGVDLGRFHRTTTAYTFKTDFTWQVLEEHLLKTGVEARVDELFLESYSLIQDSSRTSPDGLMVPGQNTNEFQRLDDVRPFTLSAYVQDKMEYEAFIVNAGLRVDYFDSSGQIPADPSDPNVFNPQRLINRYHDLNGNGQIDADEERDDNRTTLEERLAYWYTDAEPKVQISPRLGVAYPITSSGVIHFSYGHFLQIPTFEYLFNNPGYRIGTSSGTYGPYGFADIEPQRTVMYEIGLQQGFGRDFLLDVTGFYRDVRDWVSVSPPIEATLPGVAYLVYTNLDFSNVRGITVAFEKRFNGRFSFDADYTFQIAEGSNSSPEEAIAAQTGGDAPRLRVIPLNWDQRHTFNASVFVGGRTWGASTLVRLGAGYPYTPVRGRGEVIGIPPAVPTNSDRRPSTFQADLYAYRDFPVGRFTPRVYLQVYNLLDTRNAVNVFGDTGQPDVTLDIPARETIDAGYYFRPDFYAEPRRVQLGLQVSF
ncbi:MAG TPA: TonB-dependent receptor [Rubricoccaceae bacterium]|nr:TonB-dependent receptor [Rubricoccaceae bacterium]